MSRNTKRLNKYVVAQFGGYSGGMTQGYTPGGSPLTNGNLSSGGWNTFVLDESFDALLNQARQNDSRFDDETLTTEKNLLKFHSNAEPDQINYELSPEARQRLRVKKQIWQRQKNQRDSIEQSLRNNISYIQKYFLPSPEHLRTIEESLAERHLNDEKEPHPRENELPKQLHSDDEDMYRYNSRLQKFKLAVAPTHGRNTIFDVNPEEEQDDNMNPWAHQYDSFSLGYGTSGDTIKNQQDYEKSVVDGDQAKQIDKNYDETTLTFSYPNVKDFQTIGKPANREETPSSVPNLNEMQNTNLTQEERMRKLRLKSTPTRLPNDPYQAYNEDELIGQDGLSAKYLDVTPDTSNAPRMM